MTWKRNACVVGPLSVLATLAACGSSASNSPGEFSDAGGDVVLIDGGAPGDGPTFAMTDSPPGTGNGCSSDLRNVIDGAGTVVQMCPPAEGCAGGQCIDACAAAAASKGSVGCDFVLSTPSFASGLLAPCFAAFIANNWDKDVAVSVTYAGTTYDVTTFGHIPDGTPTAASWPAIPATGVPTGKVAVLFLSSDPNATNQNQSLKCPVPDAINASTAVATGPIVASGIGHTFHITTSVPVSLYDILPYGGARSFLPSAQLVFPTTAWGTNYLVVTPKHTMNGAGWLQAVAVEDGTVVQIVPTAPLAGGTGVAVAPQNVVTSYTLDAGEFIQWEGSTLGELSGTILSTNKPISVPSGLDVMCLAGNTSTGGGCDSAHQLMPPVGALGFEYVGIPYTTRRADLLAESIPYRLVGAANGTTLSYDPPVAGAPTTLNLGQSVDFEATTAFTVKSQDANHVFYATQMMTGCHVTSGSRAGITPGIDVQLSLPLCFGDEEFVIVLPPKQWLAKYVFFTDPTYATTNLALSREKTATGFQDVTVDCVGVVSHWQAVGTAGQYEVANVDLSRAGNAVGTCTSGGHVAESKGPFGLVVWGTDEFASYAYPAGGNVAPINTVVVPPVPR